MAAPTTSIKSVASVALSVLSISVWAFTDLLPLAVAPVAVACVALAILALWDIRRSQGTLTGRWLAISGIWTGIAAMLFFLGLLPAVQKVREAASRMVST